ncbi:hypothetical protein [Polaribacter cellanae]|uniref:Uncharacterized protein n=1 Tax=Polaribacter cellanae TaxID=2818493 RepID=A0A975CRZ0_9FLAO|nr:hypothetical protein [Polaribacter cellanae]QTE22842.1 hypothetical protein J3359_00780 [Polaribacter cellanae]
MKTILRPLIEIDAKKEFLAGTKLFKLIKGKMHKEYYEYTLVRLTWEVDYMMLIRKIDKKSNVAEYGIIPEVLKSGKSIINKSSFRKSLGNSLSGWFLVV